MYYAVGPRTQSLGLSSSKDRPAPLTPKQMAVEEEERQQHALCATRSRDTLGVPQDRLHEMRTPCRHSDHLSAAGHSMPHTCPDSYAWGVYAVSLPILLQSHAQHLLSRTWARVPGPQTTRCFFFPGRLTSPLSSLNSLMQRVGKAVKCLHLQRMSGT